MFSPKTYKKFRKENNITAKKEAGQKISKIEESTIKF